MPQFNPRDTKRARELRRSATPAERLLWRYLGRSQLGAKFSRQMPVGPFFADFLCRERNLIIELDGHSHDIQPGPDIVRDDYLTSAGFHVLHFPNRDVIENVDGVLIVIREALVRQAHP